MHDNRTEFTSEFLELLASYAIDSVPIIVENLYPNLVKHMHRTLGDMIRVENFEDSENPLREVDILLSSCTWALCSTVGAITMKSPAQLVFGTDMIMQVVIKTDWKEILDYKQAQTIKK